MATIQLRKARSSKDDSAESQSDAIAPDARRLVPALDRAMRIMELLEANPQRSYTAGEIARALELPKSSTFNVCLALVQGQMLRRSRNGFQLGRRLVQLGSAYVASFNLVGEFYDICRAVPLDLQATVQLAVLDEDFYAVYLGYQDCNSGLRLGLGGGIGRRVPANCTACGKALLASLPMAKLEKRLSAAELPRLTRKSITSKSRLMQELVRVHEMGYAYDDEETIPGLSCIAMAIETSHADGGYAAVSISAAKETLNAERRMTIRSTLDGIVQELRSRL